MGSEFMKKLLFAVFLGGMGSTASAGDTILLLKDTTGLAPPYAQWWYATPADGGDLAAGRHEVFVRGDGKHGDFFGILSVDCKAPENSAWMAVGGFVRPESVPAEAIHAVRSNICGDG